MSKQITMKNLNFTIDKILKLTIILAVLIVSFAVLYYLVIQPKQQRKALNECLKEAESEVGEAGLNSTNRSFYNACKAMSDVLLHLPEEQLDSTLAKLANCPESAREGISFLEYQKTKKEECYKKYPQR